MKIRNFVLLTAVLAICVTSLNFLTDSFSLSARLPDTGGQHHLEAARREASGKGLGNPHIERRPRLERELSDQEPLKDAERTRLLGRYQQPQVSTPPTQPKRQAPGLPSPDSLQAPPSPPPPDQTAYIGNPKPPPPPPAPLLDQVQPGPPPPGTPRQPQSTLQTAASVSQAWPPPEAQSSTTPPPLPFVQQEHVESTPPSPPPPRTPPASQQQASSTAAAASLGTASSAAAAASGSGAGGNPPPPPGAIQLPTDTAATFNISQGRGGDSAQALPVQPSNASLSGAAKEAAQGLISSVGQGVNATQATFAATGVLGGLAANEAVSASLPGNDSMAKGAAKALGDAGSQGQAAEGGAATGTAVNRQRYHVVASVNGNVYTAWQARVCYYWYKKARAQDTAGVMGGFTRLLHSGVPDELMDEIPTVVVNPLPEGIDKGYVVLNRPYAFQQWAHQALPGLEEDYVLMAEPDHIFLKPLPLWYEPGKHRATPHKAAAFPFFYIEPAKNKEVIQPYVKNGFPVEQMAPIGNSPVMLHKDNLTSVVDTWYNLSLSMKQDPAAEKAFGWILEMYAFAIASSQKPGGPLAFELHKDMMIQPPWDTTLQVQGSDAHILHFTYGNDYNEQGVLTYATKTHYRFDKRDYSWHYPPLDLPMPPDNVNVPSLRKLIACINEASAAMPGWATETIAHEQA